MVTVADILQFVETLAPTFMKMEWDHVGLNCGRPENTVGKVLVALDPFDEAIEEAREFGAQLLLTHHVLIYDPGFITSQDTQGRRILTLIENGFMSIVKDIKKTVDTDFSHSKKLTQETFAGIRQSLAKGGGSLSYRRITAEKMADAVVDQISNFDGITQEMKDNLRNALIPIFIKPQKGKHR